MGARIFLGFALAFIIFAADAKESQWLTTMIAEHELSAKQRFVQVSNKNGKRFFSTHGFILFYGSLCPHCKRFAPILKEWANRNKAEVLALSLDNQPLPEFPNFLPATTEWINAAFGSNAINYPALFLVNHKTKALYPVGFGSMTESELHNRMETLIARVKKYENKGRM